MARLFVSLYFFIAISLVGLTAILNALFYPTQNAPSLAEVGLVKAIRQQLAQDISAADIVLQTPMTLTQVSVNSIDWPKTVSKKLLSGELITLHSDTAKQLYFVSDTGQLHELTLPLEKSSNPAFLLYSGLFFILFGLLLLLWLWPLWRDLVKVRNSVRGLKKDGSLPAVSIAYSSVLSPIAKALNSMSEQVKSLLATQRELSGAVAHEFRTPLARLKFALAMLPQQPASQEMQQDIIELERLVQEMLDFTSVQVAAPELSITEIPLRSMCQALVNKLMVYKPANLCVSVIGDEALVLADEYYIERVIQNLLLNAFRFADKQVQIHIRQSKSVVLISVEDDGIGIPEGMEQKVFEPFFRPDKGRDRKRGGAGLGLAIVSRIVSWHQGSCSVGDAELGGASFNISLPKAS